MDMSELFRGIHENYDESNLIKANDAPQIAWDSHGFDLNNLSVFLGIPKEYIYLTGNAIKPAVAWDGQFTTLEIPPFVEMLSKYNGAWKQIERQTKRQLENGNYEMLFHMMVSNMRLYVFNQTFSSIPENKVYEVFKFVYQSSEYGFEDFHWGQIIPMCERENRHDLEILKREYGKQLTIYRGCKDNTEDGFSWTLDKEVAEFFANRFDTEGYVLKGKVDTEQVLTYIDRESEVIVEINKVEKVEKL